MENKSFSIKNYRSIIDSGDCYLSGDGLTILAGKNESGKTAILEALEDFGADESIREEAKPIHNPDLLPEISITFELNEKEIKEITKELGSEKKNQLSDRSSSKVMEKSFADAGFFAGHFPGASKITDFFVTFLVWENIGNKFLLFFSGFVLCFKNLS